LQFPNEPIVDHNFETFDEIDDAGLTEYEIELRLGRKRYESETSARSFVMEMLDNPSKDLLTRLLEEKPQFRLKSVLNLKRIAFFHNFNFDDVKNRKVSLFAQSWTIME
jgi:hypothetical protein